ncbi:DUF3231 family protein [Virgibacillus xinjiangensis]|uniref:DUF3231 family protein n=1 Tax=Virgibacillus xinjiangensis TaxID=393090 RepID=A0ABV7CXM4_9BACI
MAENNINLTSAEIGCLWTAYMNNSMSEKVLKFLLQHIEDDEIKPIISTSYDLASTHLKQLQYLLEQENYALPHAFTEEDVNMAAPWLFSDIFCLTYVNHMAKVAIVTYSGFIGMCTRKDIRQYFSNSMQESIQFFNQATDIALEKGIEARHPYIEVPTETEYINSKNYYNGLNPFSENRPLNSIEISHLYLNVTTNMVGGKLATAFAQTSPTKEVQDFLLRAKDVSQKHVKIFTSTLMEDDIQAAQSPDVCISNSTTQTFSDKLLMFHISLMTAAGIGNYAAAAAASQRSDLMVNYERLSLETARLAKSGADLMIENNWMEQPPGVKNREKLARDKGKN